LWKIVLTPAPVGDVGNGCVSVAHEKTREAASWQDDFEEFVLRGVHGFCFFYFGFIRVSGFFNGCVCELGRRRRRLQSTTNHQSSSDTDVKGKNGVF
jgi:hypothetical protein